MKTGAVIALILFLMASLVQLGFFAVISLGLIFRVPLWCLQLVEPTTAILVFGAFASVSIGILCSRSPENR